MEMTESLLAALMTVVQPYNIAVMFFGTLIGILVGAMPGLSSVMGLSIMMPLTLSMEGNSGVLMLLGIFCGAIYGGSITAILIKTPGTANSAATCLDGYPMATKLGQPGRALSISTMASTFGGLFSAVMLLWTAPMLSKIALKFGAAEYFALAVFGLSMVTSISGKSVVKGLIGAVLGLIMATIGMNSLTGTPRFTFGSVYLTGGIAMIPTLIALYAFSQGLNNIEGGGTSSLHSKAKLERVLPTWADTKLTFPTMLRSSIIGTIIGDLAGNRLGLFLRAGFAQILRDDRLIFARSDELVQTIVDGGQQIGILAFIHGHTIFAVRHLRCHDLQTVILGNTVGKHRIVVKYRVRIAGFDHLVHG